MTVDDLIQELQKVSYMGRGDDLVQWWDCEYRVWADVDEVRPKDDANITELVMSA